MLKATIRVRSFRFECAKFRVSLVTRYTFWLLVTCRVILGPDTNELIAHFCHPHSRRARGRRAWVSGGLVRRNRSSRGAAEKSMRARFAFRAFFRARCLSSALRFVTGWNNLSHDNGTRRGIDKNGRQNECATRNYEAKRKHSANKSVLHHFIQYLILSSIPHSDVRFDFHFAARALFSLLL